MAGLIEDYLTSCRARGLSVKTIDEAYGYPLRKELLGYCERAGIEDVGEISRRQIDGFAIYLQAGGPRGR